jgi:magnesium transporter
LADLVEGDGLDDAADLCRSWSQGWPIRSCRIEPEEREAMRPLLVHREDTAGGIMATEVLTVDMNCTVGDAREMVRARHEDVGAFFNVYVVDEAKRLKGILSVKDLVLQHSSTPAREAMNTDIATVPPDMDQEEVANIFRRYDLVAVPVVDEEGVLLGRITVDDVVDVMREEAEEDIARMAGTVDFDFDESSARRVALLRLPWLVVSLFGGLLAGVVLHHFTSLLTHELLMLVAFVPVITAMGEPGTRPRSPPSAGWHAAAQNRAWRTRASGSAGRRCVGLMCGIAVVALVEGTGSTGASGVAMMMAVLVATTMGSVLPIVFPSPRRSPSPAFVSCPTTSPAS